MKMDKMVKWGFIFLVLSVMVALTVILWDWRVGVDESVADRIALLERQMKDKIRPVIQINRGTVYNTDGEIVIEGLVSSHRPARIDIESGGDAGSAEK